MTTPDPLRAALEAMADRWEQEADGRVADLKADAGSLLAAGVTRSHVMSIRAALAAPEHGDHPRDAYLYDGCPGCAPLRCALAADPAPLDVERLARAYRNLLFPGLSNNPPERGWVYDAHYIAAEYVRLAKERDQG